VGKGCKGGQGLPGLPGHARVARVGKGGQGSRRQGRPPNEPLSAACQRPPPGLAQLPPCRRHLPAARPALPAQRATLTSRRPTHGHAQQSNTRLLAARLALPPGARKLCGHAAGRAAGAGHLARPQRARHVWADADAARGQRAAGACAAGYVSVCALMCVGGSVCCPGAVRVCVCVRVCKCVCAPVGVHTWRGGNGHWGVVVW